MNCKPRIPQIKDVTFGLKPQIGNILLWWAVIIAIFVSCDNRIIERAASDYYPIETGNWWRYSDNELYEPQQVYVEVESLTSVLNTDCYPVTFSGVVHYIAVDDWAVREYKELIYNYDGSDHTIARGFLTRIQLPFIQGDIYVDSVRDSIDVGGISIQGTCRVNGLVSAYEGNSLYGSVYKVIITTTETIVLPDTTFTNASSVEEYYAPGVGLMKFVNDEGEFNLSDFQLY